MSAATRDVLPADATQVITHAWSVGKDDDFDSGYEVAVINITPAYATRLLALVDLITNQLPADSIIVTPDTAAHYVDFERKETLEWCANRPEVTVITAAERLPIVEIAPDSNAGFPIPLGLRFVELSNESFRYRAERQDCYGDQCVITPYIPVSILHQVIASALEVTS